MSLEGAIGSIWSQHAIVDVFNELCDTGGRLAGTDSEYEARRLLSRSLDQIGGRRLDYDFTYTGNQPGDARCTILDGGRHLAPVCLPGSPSMEERELEIIDVGAGVESEFISCPTDLNGKAVLVRHEYPFSLQHTHRWRKYDWARQAGAAAFLIANNVPNVGPVTGGIGGLEEGAIPGVGLSYEDGEALAACAARLGRIRLAVESTTKAWETSNLLLDIPGREDRYVVLCAHIDGHNLAESAMDNATGLAAVLEIGRVLSPFVGDFRFGLRLALFTVEEWGLDGSKRYVESLTDEEKAKIVCAIALDSITGSSQLSGLTGGYTSMEDLLREYSQSSGVPIDVVRPRLPNSDHVNFQDAGIAAMRMIAGYGDANSLTRLLLTPADRREIVDVGQLKAAASVITGIIYAACNSRHL